MSKLVQAFLVGMFSTFILDFFLFLGIKLNYINFYEIDLYYNILFADHQNILLYGVSTLILGALITYVDNNKLSAIVMSTLFVLVSLTLIPSVGKYVGEMMLMQKNVVLQDNKHTFHGDIYYDGRKQITFYDYELKKMILLNKKDLK